MTTVAPITLQVSGVVMNDALVADRAPAAARRAALREAAAA